MIPSTPHGPHLHLGGDLLQRAIFSAIVVFVVALLIWLMAMALASPHTTVISSIV